MSLIINTVTDPARLRAAGIEHVNGLAVYRIEGSSPLDVQFEVERVMSAPGIASAHFHIPSRLDRAGTRWAATGYAVAVQP